MTIGTTPAVGRDRAGQLTLEAASGRLSRPRVVEQIFHVSLAHGGRRLVWLVVLEEQVPGDLAWRLYVEIGVRNGRAPEVSR